jgi:predicted DNA-binding protein
MSDKSVAVKKKEANLNRSGRKAGSKNKSTLLREALKNGFETEMEKDFIAVVRAVVDKAKDGDMAAAKMLLDRVVPVQENKMAGKIGLGEGGITIHIEKLEAQPAPSSPIDGEVEEAEYEEVAE